MKIACILLTCLVAVGCGKNSSASALPDPPASAAPVQPAAWIKSIPILASEIEFASTTLTWDTGKPAVNGQVYVTVTGAKIPQPEQLFSAGPTGSKEATWIRKKLRYEFVLYDGPERKNVLARVLVTRD